MTISNVNNTNNLAVSTVSPASATDSESRNLQNQITNAQQRLNKLSSNSEISQEEKAKKRQEIQNQIAELNRKLRQRRMEQKEEAAEAAEKQEKQKQLLEKELSKHASVAEEKEGAEQKTEDKGKNVETSNSATIHMKNMLTADSKLQQHRVQENTARKKEGLESVLETEIKSDTLYGSDTTAKKEKLSEMRNDVPLEIKDLSQPEVKNPGAADPFTTGIRTKIIIRQK